MAGELASHYNAATRVVPHCYPVGEDDMAAVLAHADGTDLGPLETESAIVVRDGSDLCGFAHYGVTDGDDQDAERRGIIRFLHYEKGRRAAGQALLEAVVEDLPQHRVD